MVVIIIETVSLADLNNITRSEKLLSIFSVVQFTNSECVVDDDTLGVCVTANEVSGEKWKSEGWIINF